MLQSMLAAIHSAGIQGIDAYPVTVEVDFARQGLPGWHLVGLPETVVRESKDRVTAALRNSGYQLRYRKTTVNLAPAARKKVGNYFDLPIAIGLLAVTDFIPSAKLENYLFAGELLLSGKLHPIRGALSIALYAREHQLTLIAPQANRTELELVKDLRFIAADTLADVVQHLHDDNEPSIAQPRLPQAAANAPDMADVKGQAVARRALEIAAAGGHHLLFLGPPGTGKTMLARRLASILPPLSYDEAIMTTRIYSAMGLLPEQELIRTRPFRAPHHSATAAGLVGGGLKPTGGEMSLAHHGVLFMDELPEFRRDALETLRQPLETGTVCITRADARLKFPAQFQLIAASNPCRCGNFGHPTQACHCSMHSIHSYRAKLSGPLLDRIDLHVPVAPVDTALLTTSQASEDSHTIRARVMQARNRQTERYRSLEHIRTNADLPAALTRQYCAPEESAHALLIQAMDQHGLSARAYDRLLRIARSIADLAVSETIEANHIAEALQYRCLERPI